MQLQKRLGSGVKLGVFTEKKEKKVSYRLVGPVAGLGDNHATYIRSALQSELFMAQLYDQSSEIEIIGNVDSIKFSSVSPASWMIGFTIRSNKSPGYSVETVYPFRTSYSALSACQNVASAFEPAVKQLIRDITRHLGFEELLENDPD